MNFETIKNISNVTLQILPTLLLTYLTIYFSYQKLFHKITIGFSKTISQLSGKYISNLIITNKKDKIEIIHKISIIIDKQYKYDIIEFKSPLVVNPNTAIKIDPEEVSEYYLGTSSIDFISMIKLNNYFFEIKTDDKTIFFVPQRIKRFKQRKEKYTPIISSREIFNDVVISRNVIFAVLYRPSEEIHKTAFITKNGLILGDWDFSYRLRQLPENILDDKTKIIKYFEKSGIVSETKGFAVTGVKR
jgi:hypothetical protein